MASPPMSHNLLTTAAGRRKVKAARRMVLVQCDQCSAAGSGQLNGFGRMTSVNLAARRSSGNTWRHADCGGCLRAFDIAVTP